jgi:hypothetical protein
MRELSWDERSTRNAEQGLEKSQRLGTRPPGIANGAYEGDSDEQQNGSQQDENDHF